MNINTTKGRVQTVLDTATASGEVAGANVLILQEGKELFYCQSGFADLENQKPMNRDTIVRLYSMSKPITATAAILLMEQGIIDLADPVEKFLPAFQNLRVQSENGTVVPARRLMTIRDLLSMTSGLLYGGPNLVGRAAEAVFEEIKEKLTTASPMTTLEVASALGSCPLAFHPGEHFMYGTSADILGAVIEAASGMSFGSYLKTYLFDPLGMSDTGFYVPEEKQNRLAKVYEITNGTLTEFQTNHLGIRYDCSIPASFESGGAGLSSTLDDYARFASMLIHDGSFQNQQILLPRSVDYLTHGKLLPWQETDLWHDWDGLTGYTYGNLMRVMEHPGMCLMQSTVGEYGWDGWLGPYFSNHPNEKLTILFSIQKRDAGTCALTRKVRNIVLSAL